MITIDSFQVDNNGETEYIKWNEIHRILGDDDYLRFLEWMKGQTCIEEGVYTCDVENYLRKPTQRFFD